MLEFFSDYTFRSVFLGTALLGLACGMLGTIAVLRNQSLVGDAISHAALPGICLSFMIFHSRSPLILILGAALSGGISMWFYQIIKKHTKLDSGAILGTLLTTFFGFGVLLLTIIQKRPDASQAGLDKYLFGQVANMTTEHILTVLVISVIALTVFTWYFRPFKVLAFDHLFAESAGMKTTLVTSVFTVLLVVAVVLGLNAVGVVLLSAMLVGPTVAARQWSSNLSTVVVIAGILGAICGGAGAVLSTIGKGYPTGPVVICALAVCVLISVVFGKERGLFWRNRIRKEIITS